MDSGAEAGDRTKASGRSHIGGAAGLEPKKWPGNKFAALHRSKDLSELERLRLLVAKQEVEIARLKKDIGWKELAHKCCKYAGIQSKARKYRYKKKDDEENVEFPNEVNGNWNATALGYKSPVQYKTELGF